jgi:hypothetical protein
VISIAKAERDPSRAAIPTVAAGCTPVRVVVSANGKIVWVTARGNDQLLAFSAKRLITDPSHARLATVRVTGPPIGLALIDNDSEIVVACVGSTTRKPGPGRPDVVSSAAALMHRRALLGTIPAGVHPRELGLEPNHTTLLVGNFGSDQLEAVAINRGLPDV